MNSNEIRQRLSANAEDFDSIISDVLRKMERFEKLHAAANELSALKYYKDLNGKDDLYHLRQPDVWEALRQALKDIPCE